MKIVTRCAECNNEIKVTYVKVKFDRSAPKATDEELSEMVREAEEQKRNGYLKLFCQRCNHPVEINTEAINENERN